MISKNSYSNKRLSRRYPAKEIPTPPPNLEGMPSGSTGGIGRGYTMPGEPTQPATISEVEEQNIPLKLKNKKKYTLNYDNLMELFGALGDALDDDGLHSEADFIDFLIVKVAQQSAIDYSMFLKNLLIKIVKSDLPNSQDIIKEVVKTYNYHIIKNKKENINQKECEKIAYQHSVEIADQYVTKLY